MAFHPSGKKLILGAQPVRRNQRAPKKPSQPIRIWDVDTDHVKETKILGVGPVAFNERQVLIALTVKENAAMPGLVLWDLETEKPLRELVFPPKAKGKVEEWVLSANGTFAAARWRLMRKRA